MQSDPTLVANGLTIGRCTQQGSPVTLSGLLKVRGAARANHFGLRDLIPGVATLLAMTSCATTARLDANFNSDALSARPSQAPSPTPPNDQLTWTTQKPLTSTVVADPAGGRWVRVVPLPAFTAAPDNRQLIVIASTEPFTINPPASIRGSLRLRLDDLGGVIIGFQPKQNTQLGNFIAAIELGNFLGSTANPSRIGSVDLARGFSPDWIGSMFSLPSAGNLAAVRPGSPIQISWSVDQMSHTFAASVGDGSAQTTQYALPATTPFEQMFIYIWLERPTTATNLFVDDLYVEEY